MKSTHKPLRTNRICSTKQLVIILNEKHCCLEDIENMFYEPQIRKVFNHMGVSVLGYADAVQVRQIISVLKGADLTLPQ